MDIAGMAHVTLLCSPAQLAGVEDFYRQLLGLTSGARPSFDFPGTWLYAGTEPIVHLAAVLQDAVTPASAVGSSSRSSVPGGALSTGPIDHVAFRVKGTVSASREQLDRRGIPFTEAPVPDFPLYQLFFNDPLGVKIELNFELAA
jgi:catechol 2,3-dioxygenase-like lactoylglutathione lyase family enzyme